MPAELRFYVYALVDPRNGETFYIGKGCGDRVKRHRQEARSGKTYNFPKCDRINEIAAAGMRVEERILERFRFERDAIARETTLIRGARESLTNIAPGRNPDNAIRRKAGELRQMAQTCLWIARNLTRVLRCSDLKESDVELAKGLVGCGERMMRYRKKILGGEKLTRIERVDAFGGWVSEHLAGSCAHATYKLASSRKSTRVRTKKWGHWRKCEEAACSTR